ncbi:hypothetical protein L1049_000715 [Liquidambar formosana]|uniref:CRM domain-containing protein n=1 Tax=Liquidambar formosana TaxID=63359 RepID=A0AAP0R5M6_LIQFO
MALKITFPFPIFSPPNPTPSHHRPPTEIRFSRWNNANAKKFNRRERAQQEIEDDIRRERRFHSATNIANISDSDTDTTTETFKSIGTPSSPSKPSIPGKKSKYSKNPNPKISHPAFRRIQKVTKIQRVPEKAGTAGITVCEDGVSYMVEGAPFEFAYSYTEKPKVKPLALREPPFSPFGPNTMPRPWTGRAPLPPSKKKLKEFDSFQLPPPHKKGVKPVQKPGPYLPGTGPKYVKSREEILGEPLTAEEVKELVQSCVKSQRQLNMGRDGLTHNMLDNIHAHWKRRRVCKIKCKGVCTVDMENVRQQLEEKTGGKIIYSRGGVLFLFRGRNYNYKTRPRFPLMLWKPVTPVYPRLIKQAPEGLTLEEAGEMRKKGRKLIPICKLAKNGVYSDLVKDVREAFEECELVRINCQGMNGSDHRKIGAKLKDLVPCVLISFEHEYILMWRGRDWKSSLPEPEDDSKEGKESETDGAISIAPPLEGQEVSALCVPKISVNDMSLDTLDTSMLPMGSEDVGGEKSLDQSSEGNDRPFVADSVIPNATKIDGNETRSDNSGCADDDSKALRNTNGSETISDNAGCAGEELTALLVGSNTMLGSIGTTENQLESFIVDPTSHDKMFEVSEASQELNESARLRAPCTQGVLLLWKQALESGSAVVLDDATLDADIVYERAVAFAQSAPTGPVFRRRPRKVVVQKSEKQENGDLEVKEVITVPAKRGSERKSSRIERMKDFKEDYQDVVPQGSLRLDELAKLLA